MQSTGIPDNFHSVFHHDSTTPVRYCSSPFSMLRQVHPASSASDAADTRTHTFCSSPLPHDESRNHLSQIQCTTLVFQFQQSVSYQEPVFQNPILSCFHSQDKTDARIVNKSRCCLQIIKSKRLIFCKMVRWRAFPGAFCSTVSPVP